MNAHDHFKRMARYKVWVTQHLFTAYFTMLGQDSFVLDWANMLQEESK
jgi:uncharacterized damage-inducible protein DinB